jgi:hypothetical protein
MKKDNEVRLMIERIKMELKERKWKEGVDELKKELKGMSDSEYDKWIDDRYEEMLELEYNNMW